MPKVTVISQQDAGAAEAEAIKSALTPGFVLKQPARQTVPFVFCSPHSGRIYPKSFLRASRLTALGLRKSEDCYVDQLFDGIPGLGAPLLCAQFPRAYLDVNRQAYELDPKLFKVPLPHYANTKSARVAGGLGTIARIVSEGEEIYAQPLSLAAAEERIRRLYVPFHEQLSASLRETAGSFGQAILIDCHSMPSATVGRQPGPRPDFVLGDRFGETCAGCLTDVVQDLLTAMGYQVQLNRPYAGGFITENYGTPLTGTHALQIEINRALYMNERTLKPIAAFKSLQRDLTKMVQNLFEQVPQLIIPQADAAE